MHGTYIFAENEKGLYIIDQHAAQERIKYEYFKEKIGEVSNDLQELLIPLTLQFSNDEFIKLEENLEELKKSAYFSNLLERIHLSSGITHNGFPAVKKKKPFKKSLNKC